MPLVAVTVKLKMPLLPTAGVPLRTPVELLRLTPTGRVPLVTLKLAAGKPVTVKVNVPAEPATKPVLSALVKVGDPPMLIVRVWLVAPAPLVASSVTV